MSSFSFRSMQTSFFKGSKKKGKSLYAPLMLTSLVDAFSILVIYLLVNFSTSGEMLFLSKDMELPSAKQGVELERFPVVKIEKGKIYVEEEEISPRNLMRRLLSLKRKYKSESVEEGKKVETLIIQADKDAEYRLLNPIVLAGAQSGFSDVRFAVLSEY